MNKILSTALPLLTVALMASVSGAALAQARPAADAGQQQALREQLRKAEEDLRGAREQLVRSARELARIQAQLGEETPFARAFSLLADPQRAALGVSIAPGPVEKGKVRGLLVTGVTPGSGAEKAGIQSGDLILGANGKSLELAEDARPGPGLSLRQILRELEPGTVIGLEIERDGKRKTLQVMAQRQDVPGGPEFDSFDIERFGPRGDLLLPRPPGEPLTLPLPPMPAFAAGAGRPFIGGPFAGPGFQLARLDEDLAGYFKTREGVLVVKAPPALEGTPALKSGDVIQSVNGEPVRSPVEVLERLFALGPQSAVTLQVVRQGSAISLQGTLPELPPRPARR